jgi:hypothetical protein
MNKSVSAVITADIVNSTLLNKKQEKQLMSSLTDVLKPYKYEFYRGDSFQVYFKSPVAALSAILKARVAAIQIEGDDAKSICDIRASIGIGEVNVPVKSLRTATGEAFILSGRTFDLMSPMQRLSISMSDTYEKEGKALKIVSYFLDYLFNRLTSKQAEVIFELLEGKTQKEAALKLQKAAPTISKHAHSAGWSEIETLLVEYNAIVEKMQVE